MQPIRLENLDIYSIRVIIRYYLFTIVTIIIITNVTKLYYIYDYMLGLSHLLIDFGIKLDFNLSVLHLSQMFVVYVNCTYVT